MSLSDVEILLVDDNPDDVELTLHALRQEKLGNTIQVARDGAEALDYIFRRGQYVGCNNGHPRLVLLDLKLPKVDGLQVLKVMKADPSTEAIPVVILTSSRQETDLVSGYKLGVNAYIQKPVDFDQFCKMVKTLGLFWLVVNQPPPAATLAA